MARAKSFRGLIAIGNNHGLESKKPLAYAQNDAKRFADLMIRIGDVPHSNVILSPAEPSSSLANAIAQNDAKQCTDLMIRIGDVPHSNVILSPAEPSSSLANAIAQNDAKQCTDLMIRIGDVPHSNVILLPAEPSSSLANAIAQITQKTQELKPKEVTLCFDYSGHGADKNIHLGDHRYALDKSR